MHGIGRLLIAATMMIALNLPMYVRNYRFTHTLLGNPDNRIAYVNAHFGAGPTTSNAIRNFALEMVSPWKIGRTIDERAARFAHRMLGLNPDDRESMLAWKHFNLSKHMWNGEDNAGNPAHTILFLAGVVTLYRRNARADLALLIYATCILLAFLMFCGYVRSQPFHTRLLMPLLVISSPFVAIVMERNWKKNLGCWIALVLAPIGATCVMSNHLHPYWGRHGIFSTDRTSRYFLNLPRLEAPCRKIADEASKLRVKQVGLILDSNDLEYPLDVLLKRVDPSIRVEPMPQPGLLDPHTSNRGWNNDLRPWMIVQIKTETAVEVFRSD